MREGHHTKLCLLFHSIKLTPHHNNHLTIIPAYAGQLQSVVSHYTLGVLVNAINSALTRAIEALYARCLYASRALAANRQSAPIPTAAQAIDTSITQRPKVHGLKARMRKNENRKFYLYFKCFAQLS